MKNEYLTLFSYNSELVDNPKTEFNINQNVLLEALSKIESLNENSEIKYEIHKLIEIIKNPLKDNIGLLKNFSNGDVFHINKNLLLDDLVRIANSHTIERAKYYIIRLKKSLTEIKTNKINDLNLNRWKEYDDILTDSLWIIDKRDKSGTHNAGYWGNFIPQIPNQLLRRYTKKGEYVLDTFLGSGTTLIECRRLGRHGVGVELLPSVAELANKNISLEENKFNVKTEVIIGDSTQLDFQYELKKRNIKSVQFLIMHPPYWDIIKFSKDRRDLSNSQSLEEFLNLFGKVVDNTYEILDKDRYFALVIGDKYSKGEWIPLAFYAMEEVLNRGYLLKSIIFKIILFPPYPSTSITVASMS